MVTGNTPEWLPGTHSRELNILGRLVLYICISVVSVHMVSYCFYISYCFLPLYNSYTMGEIGLSSLFEDICSPPDSEPPAGEGSSCITALKSSILSLVSRYLPRALDTAINYIRNMMRRSMVSARPAD